MTTLRPIVVAAIVAATASIVSLPTRLVEASNDLTLAVSAPGEQLLTDPALVPVTMTATNPSTGGDGQSAFNGSFTAILPAGATFDSGPFAPSEMSVLVDGRTALFFENIGDIQEGSTLSLDFTVSVAAAAFPVGSTIDVEGHFGANTDPRTVPDFNPTTGTFAGDTTGPTPTDSSSTLLSALQIDKANATVNADEMLRGVHDHVETYQLLVSNNGIANNNSVVVDDFVPAIFEYLGCGGVDNTTDAPTNPQPLGDPPSPLEYPGAPLLTATPAPGGPCPVPDLVESVTVTGGIITSGTSTNGTAAPASVVDGVYTHLRWDLGTLTPAEFAAPYEINYQVGIPIRANTYDDEQHTATGGTNPTANLDNNGGPFTTEDDDAEQTATNVSSVGGTYTGPVATGFDPTDDNTDESSYAVSVEDLAIQKSVTVPGPIVQGAIVRYDLDIQTSEYRLVTGAVITDTLSDGQCPVLTAGADPENVADQTGECAITSDQPSFSLPATSVTENTDGSYTLVIDNTNVPALASLAPSSTLTLSFSALIRESYQQDFLDDAPFNGADRAGNDVAIAGTTNLVAGIPDNPSIDATPIQDDGSASFQAGTASIDKLISLPVAPGATLNCLTATYVSTTVGMPPAGDPYAYRIGDRVCFRLGVDFVGDLNFRNARVDDFLPEGSTFEQVWVTSGAVSETSAADGDNTGATANNEVIIDSIELISDPAGDLVSYRLGEQDPDTVGGPFENDLFVSNGGVRFEVIISAVVTEAPADRTAADIVANLQKFTSSNLTNESISLRDQADFQIVQPNLSVTKDVDPTVSGEGIPVDYTLEITNDFSDSGNGATYNAEYATALNVSVWDLLPPGVDCVDIGALTLDVPGSISCTDDLITGRDGLEITVDRLEPQATAEVTYTFTPPVGTPAGASLTNDFGIRNYQGTPTNDGDADNDPLFVPSSNIDPGISSDDYNMPPAEAQATITTPNPVVVKEQQSSITDPGNDSNGALSIDPDEATIGETVQYRTSTSVVESVTVYNGSFDDTLPAGMSIVSVDSVRLIDDGVLPGTDLSSGGGGFTFTNDASSWLLTFPSQYDNLAGTGTDEFVITYTAVVDGAGLVAGDDLDNTSQFSFDDAPAGGTPVTVDSNEATINVVEPSPAVSKSNNATDPATPSAEITYSLAVTNPDAADVSSAYDVEIVDTVPAGVTPLSAPAGALMVADGPVTGPSSSVGQWDESARTITWNATDNAGLGQVDPDGLVTLDYAAVLNIPAVADQPVLNTAVLSATSTPGINGSERTTYSSNSQSAVTPPPATIAKSVPSAQTVYAVGEVVDFELTVTLPAGTVGFDTTVFDQLPAELTFDSFGTATFSGPECQVFDAGTGTAVGAYTDGDVTKYVAGVGGDLQRIAWFLDEIAADPIAALANCVVTLPYAAHVDDDGNDGDSFNNSADLVWNAADDIPPAPAALPIDYDDPDDTDWDRSAGPAEVTLEVDEPQLELDIDTLTPTSALAGFTNDQTPGNDIMGFDDPDGTAASAPGGIDGDGGDVAPGETLTQRVTVTNSGTADAFDTTVVVSVGDGATPIDSTSGLPLAADGPFDGPNGELGVWDSTSRTITFLPADNTDLAGAIAPAGTATLEYETTLDASDSLTDLQDITDAADVPTYFGVPTAEQSQPDVPTYGNDVSATRGAVDGDETTVEVHFPELTVVKAAISDATDARLDTPFTFQFVITNTDAVATAYDVDANDTLPAGWNYVAGSATVTSPSNAGVNIEPTGAPAGPLVWADLDTLAPGETITIVYQAQPDTSVLAPDKATGIANTGAFAHTNTVDVAGDDASGSPTFDGGTPISDTDDQDVFIRQVDLAVTKAVVSPPLPSDIFFGGFVEYEIAVTNAGPDDATGVELTDDNVAGTGPADTILFVGVVSADRGTFDGVTGVWTVGDVAAGETLTLVVRTQMNTVDPPAPAVNEVEVSAADQFDADSDPANLVPGSPVEDDETGVSISPLPTTLGNYIWLDLNGDGVQDVGEPGIPDVPVVLTWTEPGGQNRQFTVITDAAGAYNVPLLFIDEITLNPTSLPLFVDITATVDTSAPNLAGLTPIQGPESDIDGGAFNTSTQQIQDNAVSQPDGTLARLDVDFGYQPGPQELGNRVWWDQDASGDATDGVGEYGIGGVTLDITWYGFDDLPLTADDLTFQTVTSDGTIDVDGDSVADPAGTWSSFYDPVAATADRNIPPGTYDVVVDAASLLAGISVDTYDLDGGNPTGSSTATAIALALGGQRDDVDFSVAGVGVIGDTVYYDANGGGIQTAGEPGISGVTVELTWAGPDGDFSTLADNAVLTTVTSDGTTDVDGDLVVDPAGTYLFPNLPDGTFDVVVDPLGTTLPADVTQTGDPDGPPDGMSRVVLDSLTGATTDLDQDFGYQGDLSVGDAVFYDVDANGSGVLDGADVPMSAIDVTVTWAGNDGVFGSPDDSSTTVTTSDGSIDVNGDTIIDPPGFYQVDGLPSGEVRIEIVTATLPAGLTTPTFDGDEPGAPGTITTPNVSVTTLAGSDDLDQDFSFTGSGGVGDTVWWDRDADGIQGPDEPGMAGVPVMLTSAGPDGFLGTADDLTINTVTSDGTTDVDGDTVVDPAGSYWFPNLLLDVPVTITVDDSVLPPTFPPTHDADDTADGSVVSSTPNEATTTLSAVAPQDRDVDFGYAGPGAVGDVVWLDLNGDGVEDAGEPGLAGVGIDVRFAGADGVFDTADDVVATTVTSDGTTDLDGDSIVDPPGSYYVDGLPLDEPIRVSVDAAALPAELAPTGDFDGTGTPNSSLVTLDTAGPTNLDQDFGYAGPGAVGDTVWYDVNGDRAPDPVGSGVFDAPDVPLIGIPVTVTGAGLDGSLGTSDDFVLDLVTDVNGEYLAPGLFFGEYEVVVDVSALPAGVTTQTYDPDVTFDAMAAVTLSVGTPQALDQDFSFTAGGAVGDTVWFDQDGDGLRGPGEPGLVGIPVTLTSPGPDGLPGTSDDLSVTTLTSDGTTDVDGDTVVDPAGSYYVANLLLDVPITIAVTDASLPAGLVPVFDNDGTGTPHTSTATLTAAEPIVVDHDFGYAGTGSIGDTVFFDVDGVDSGGVPDTLAGDAGIVGVEVTLTWTNSTGGPDLVVTATTSDGTTDVDGDTVIDPAGTYVFPNLPEGDYTITIDPLTLPSGVAPVFDPEGNGDLATAVTLDSVLNSDLDRDFSFSGTGSIGDLIWLDSDADGVVGPGETGVPGVVVVAEYTDPVTGASMTLMTPTDTDGRYLFENVPAGDYTVSYDPDSLPTGYGAVADPDATIDGSTDFVLVDGETRDDVDFGVRPMATVDGVIFDDIDGDGIQGPDEPGLAGVDVEITDANGDVVTVTTDADGRYVAIDVLAGDLTVDVVDSTLPADVQLSTGNEPQPITAPAGATTTPDPIGYAPLTFISGTIGYDVDASGDLGAGEPGLAGIVVELLDGDGAVVATTTTNVVGFYEFVDVPTGIYTIRVDESTLPAGLDRATFDPDGTLDGSHPLTLLPDGCPDKDFGYTGTGSITDTVWVDTDGDGTADPEEQRIGGVELSLTWAGPDGIFGTADDVTFDATSTTDGAIDIPNLPAGSYRVVIDVTTVPNGLELVGEASFDVTLGDGRIGTLGGIAFESPQVPQTGGDPGPAIRLALLLFVAGLLLIVGTRRRDRAF